MRGGVYGCLAVTAEVDGAAASAFKVVIAGGGVAGAEALLALRHLMKERITVELVCPRRDMSFRPFAVAEPFGLGETHDLRLDVLAQEQAADFREDALATVEADRHTITTESGASIGYDALLIAVGCRWSERMPGALNYDGSRRANSDYRVLLDELEAGKIRRIVYAVPTWLRWTLPIYDLALLTARHAGRRALAGVEIVLASAEGRPVEMFGRRASDTTAAVLEEAGIEFLGSHAPMEGGPRGLLLSDGRLLEADRVVALPGASVAPIPGVPQGPSGFIGTDRHMQVESLPRVYAAGDATWFPIKQGGLAAQQADVAAETIASCVDPVIPKGRFRPVLRGALLGGPTPLYVRSGVAGTNAPSAVGAAPLWWPPTKIGARYLAPYLGWPEEAGAGPRGSSRTARRGPERVGLGSPGSGWAGACLCRCGRALDELPGSTSMARPRGGAGRRPLARLRQKTA